jgi:endoglucanase
VGSPDWSSHPDQCANAGITDANYGCSLHFYAATGAHQVSDNGDSYNNRALKAMQNGVPVFATEWGTVSADGNGSPDGDHSRAWVNWMNQNGVSWANWSASAIKEGSAAFNTLTLNQGLQYTTSGSMVKGFLAGSHNYSDCGLENSIGSSSDDDGFSAGVANGATTDIIDDMEDGDRYTYSGGFWSAWADSDDDTDGRGATKISNKKYTNDFNKETYDVIIKAKEGNDSKYMAGMEGIYIDQGSYKWAPYVAMGLNLTKDTSEFSQLANCKTISYKYKGAAHNFRVEISPITNYNFHYVDAEASGEWRTVELTTDMFQQHTTWSNPQIMDLAKNLGKTKRLAWEVNGVVDRPASEIQPLYNYLYVDDVRCDGISFKAISGNSASNSSSSTGKSSSSQGGNSSSSVAPTSSSSVEVVLKEIVLIDDVEDGDEVLKTGGTWYAYNDSAAGGLSTILNTYDASLPGYVVTFAGTEDPTNGTAGFVGLKGIVVNPGTYEERPFAALGLNTNADTSIGIDLSACTAISYRYKGAAHDFKLQDGQVQDYDYHLYKVSSSTEWQPVVILLEDISQKGWGAAVDLNYSNIKKMSWEVLGWAKSQKQPEYDYLYVDDLKCVSSGTDAVRLARKAASLKLSVNDNVLNVVTAASASIQVFDMMGNLVMSRVENAAGNHQVSFEGVNRGNYVVRVKSAGAAQTARVSIR